MPAASTCAQQVRVAVPADHVVGLVSGQPLGTVVPVGDRPFAVDVVHAVGELSTIVLWNASSNEGDGSADVFARRMVRDLGRHRSTR